MKKVILTLLLICGINTSFAKLVEYNFDIDNKIVNFSDKDVVAIAIGGQIPAPVIEATVGDTLRVTFNNKMDEATSIHWHGVLLPNDQDGVPFLTTSPLKPHTSFTYEYTIRVPGTYWYHSHSGLQEQRGMYGPLVFHPKTNRSGYDKEKVIVFSDWTNEHPNDVLVHLKRDGDYYALKKDSVQSWLKVIQHGMNAIKTRMQGAWSRMGPMDLSDVGYDAFLANGKIVENFSDVKKDDRILLRLINSGAASYFNVEFAGGIMTVVAADGVDVQPFKTKRLKIAIAETYDIIINLPENKAYELRATAKDGTGYSSTFIGSGEKVFAQDIAKPNLFVMDHSMHGMHKEYSELRSVMPSTLPSNQKTREISLTLNGVMDGYIWSFNNTTFSQADSILIKKGENVRMNLTNQTMMEHPIHLHGHFFRVLNGHGDHAPLKHTVNVPSMSTVSIEFDANEEKDWFFHCHNLYHMKAGLSRVVSYEDTTTVTKNIISNMEGDSKYYATMDAGFQSNLMDGLLQISNPNNAFVFEYEYDYDDEYDIDLLYKRTLSRFLMLYAGANLERKDSDSEAAAVFGFNYLLPLMIELDVRVDHEGEFWAELSSDLQLTNRLNFDWWVDTGVDARFSLTYEITKTFYLSANYDTEYGGGAGIRIKL